MANFHPSQHKQIARTLKSSCPISISETKQVPISHKAFGELRERRRQWEVTRDRIADMLKRDEPMFDRLQFVNDCEPL